MNLKETMKSTSRYLFLQKASSQMFYRDLNTLLVIMLNVLLYRFKVYDKDSKAKSYVNLQYNWNNIQNLYSALLLITLNMHSVG